MPACEPISVTMADGTTARGHCNFDASAVEIEQVVVRHEMSDGTFAEERVWRQIAPPPAPEPAPPQQQQQPEDQVAAGS